MKIAAQDSAEFAHVAKLIDDIPIAMLTTIEDDHTLISRPMAVLEMDAHGALWFFTDVHSPKVEHLRVANLSFTDTDHGTYVSLSGRGEIETDRAHIQRLWSAPAKPWFPASRWGWASRGFTPACHPRHPTRETCDEAHPQAG